MAPTEMKEQVFLKLTLMGLLMNVPFCFGALPFKHFSSKTPYSWLEQSKLVPQDDELYYLNDIPGMSCTAVHATAVIRHGTRYPGLEDVDEITHVHERLVGAMELDVNEDLYNWKNQFPSNNKKSLAHAGEVEQEELGKRMAKRLFTLFADEDMTNLKFIVSSQERTKQSASAFYDGFMNIAHGDDDQEEEFDAEVNDEFLRFFDLCSKYVYDVKDNETAHKEFYAFLESDKIIAIKDKMLKKLEISSDVLTTADVRLIYLICGYETAIFNSSPWCSLLDEEDMEVLEYLGDLKHYYKNGYGFNITTQQTCPLVSEIFMNMDEAILEIETTEDDEEIDGYIVGQFMFGHAETVGPLYTALGLFNDSEPLRADNYNEQSQRLFRTSGILPFSANLELVLYECLPEDIGEEEEVDEGEYYLKMLVNEVPTVIPGCEELHCPYKQVRDRHSKFIDYCNFKQICKRKVQKDEL